MRPPLGPALLLAVTVAIGPLPGCSSCTRGAEVALAIDPCAAPGAALLEVHAPDGALQLALRPADGGALALCDAQARRLGTLTASGRPPSVVMTIKGPGGALLGAFTGHPAGEDPTLTVHGGATLRLHDERELLRILDAQGVPLGQVGRQAGRGIAFDPGGRPIATAEPVAPNDERFMVRTPDASLRYLLRGVKSHRAAAAFALETLDLPERLLLARHLESLADAAPPIPSARDGEPGR